MLLISNAQIRKFEAISAEAHRQRVTILLLDLDPTLSTALDETEQCALAEAILRQAAKVRLQEEGFQDFVRFAIQFGVRFLDDPQCPWAHRLSLNSFGAIDGSALVAAGQRAFVRELGESAANLSARAAARLATVGAIATIDAENLAHEFSVLWPERAHALGPQLLGQMARRHLVRARSAGAADPAAEAMLATAFFLLGSWADEDPQHPGLGALRAAGNFDAARLRRTLAAGLVVRTA